MDRLAELEIFTRVAEEASLTRAADCLGLSVSGVSRHLTSLEERLSVRLVHRTTRQLTLTPEGEQFAIRAREILGRLNEAETQICQDAAEPKGTLKLGCSLSFAQLHMLPVIAEFKQSYPGIHIDLQISNRYCDIIENGLDLAVRTRSVESDSSITIRKLAETSRLMAASPDYIERRGVPEKPEDLAKHSLLLYNLSADWESLRLTRDGETLRVPVSGELVCNDGQILRRAALDGLGIVVQPAYILSDDIKAGRLVPVLTDWELPRLTMNLAFPSKTHMPARTRLFIDSLVSYFGRKRFEQEWRLPAVATSLC